MSKTQKIHKVVKQVKKEPVVITRDGKSVATLVNITNAEIETVSLSNNPKFIALIERSRARQKSEGGISSEEMRLEKPRRFVQAR
jgi:antitoxin (DNA-binding transcriptional repressor) of toxin-antitoxin stability system